MTFPCVRPDSPRDGGAGYLDDRQAALLSVAVGPEDRLALTHADQAGADRGHDRDTPGVDVGLDRIDEFDGARLAIAFVDKFDAAVPRHYVSGPLVRPVDLGPVDVLSHQTSAK